MPVVVATLYPQPEHFEALRDAMSAAVAAVHSEPGCQFYALHEADGSLIVVEQWESADALATHSSAPALAKVLGEHGQHMTKPPNIVLAEPLPAGDPDKGQLVR